MVMEATGMEAMVTVIMAMADISTEVTMVMEGIGITMDMGTAIGTIITHTGIMAIMGMVVGGLVAGTAMV
jgi:hypothetical protein